MEKITTKKELIEMLKDLVAVETVARDNYEKDTHIFVDPKFVDVISHIKSEEDEHIELLNSLLEILG
jgi:rubrerythrin